MNPQQFNEIEARFATRHQTHEHRAIVGEHYVNGAQWFLAHVETDVGALLEYVRELRARVAELEYELEATLSHFGEDV